MSIALLRSKRSMSNPITETTAAILERLDPETRAAAEANVREFSSHALGQEVSLEYELNLIKAAKFLAAADGLSAVELRGLKAAMTQCGLPEAVQWHILEFDESQLHPSHIGALVERGRPARFFLSAILHFAALDGLSDDEAASARVVGWELDIHPSMIEALILEARANHEAQRHRDSAQQALLRDLRLAIIELPMQERETF